MKTVKDVSELTGISIRTLRYYDEIGLLKPTKITEAGYRLYDDSALAKLEEIMFFKELDISLQNIKILMENPNYDKEQLLKAQKILLERKRNRLNGIIQLIEDRLQGGVMKMDFERFSEGDAKKIFEHSLKLQSKESLDAVIQHYGGIEKYWESFLSELTDEKTSEHVIKIYGSKDKAIEASLKADGDQNRFSEFQEQIDEIYRQFADAMDTDNDNMAMELVDCLSENYKAMFNLDNARTIMLEVADDYLGSSILADAVNKQYGNGVAEYIGYKIRHYYGV